MAITWQEISTPSQADRSGHFLIRFPNLSAMVQQAQQACNPNIRDGPSRRFSRLQDDFVRNFTKTDSFEQATDLALYGWKEGESRILDLSERVTSKVSTALPSYGMELAEEGGDVDVAGYLAGDRVHMWDWRDDGNKKPVIKLTINGAYDMRTTGSSLMSAGSLIVSLVDALETVGKRVEVDVWQPTHGGGGGENLFSFCVVTQIKQADEPLDLSALAYVIAHPSYFRRHWFSLAEQLSDYGIKAHRVSAGQGYGSPFMDGVPDEEKGDIHLALQDMATLDAIEGYDFVIQELERQGVDLDG